MWSSLPRKRCLTVWDIIEGETHMIIRQKTPDIVQLGSQTNRHLFLRLYGEDDIDELFERMKYYFHIIRPVKAFSGWKLFF